MRYYTTSQLSEHIRETPEGYLLCLDVPIARIGEQLYQAAEVPDVTPGPDGLVRVRRTPEEVFAPKAIASFEGKSVTLLHPQDPDAVEDPGGAEDEVTVEFVTPENWKDLTCGVGLNIRRGEKQQADLLLADLQITDAAAIAAVRGGLRQVSCGYDADHVAEGPGRARQVNIVGNHIALVPRGRAGSRCAIKDAQNLINREFDMPDKLVKKSFLTRFADAIRRGKTADEAAAEAAAETVKAETPPPAKKEEAAPTADNGTDAAGMNAKLDELLLLCRSFAEKLNPAPATDAEAEETLQNADAALEAETAKAAALEEKPTKTGDAAPGSRGSRLADAETVRRARILAPGIASRVGDSDYVVKKTCLRQAMADADLKKVVDSCLAGQALDAAPAHMLDAAFLATSFLAAANNNRRMADALGKAAASAANKSPSPADINKRNREFYGKKAGA